MTTPNTEQDQLEKSIDINLQPSSQTRIRAVVADAFSFVRSAEANQALATVTLDDLIEDQIRRNGDSAATNGVQYNPYERQPGAEVPSGAEAARVNFVGGTDTGAPSRLERIQAIAGQLGSVLDSIRARDPVDVADPEEYNDAVETSPDTDIA